MRNLVLAPALAATASLVLGAAADAQPRGPGGPPIGPNGLPGGTWTTVCRNGSMGNGVLSAECKDAVGRYHSTSLPLQNCSGDIGDQNGVLACGNGVKGSAGPVVADQPQARNDRGDRRGADNGAAFGAFAGALLGGALAGNAGAPPPPPPPPPPAYGDARYGDPRYDWRYQQGGFGYGHRPGEWIPIEQRADWLNRQIDQLQRDGRIDFRDARDYRRQLDRIENRERELMRSGSLGARERAELDQRFGDLTAEIRRDARED